MERFLTNQSEIYSGVLLSSLAIVLLWELFYARRPGTPNLARRWRNNFLLLFINLVVINVVIPVTAISAALLAKSSGFGLFNQLQVPFAVVFIVSLLLMDLANYLQHYLLHRVPLFWRVHRLHHADPACDVTTSFRFHPFEAIISLSVDICIAFAFGLPPVAVAVYSVFRIAVSTVVHGNIRIHAGMDSLLRYLLVTPDMHRVHHSRLEKEHNSNFSGGLIWWDYLFGTYIARPAAGHQEMDIGLSGYSDTRATSLVPGLMDPFSRHTEMRVAGKENTGIDR
jgi:sterol desaturase/sphingolipid hydroxylase (fatty acid hydroxylase superfamily)